MREDRLAESFTGGTIFWGMECGAAFPSFLPASLPLPPGNCCQMRALCLHSQFLAEGQRRCVAPSGQLTSAGRLGSLGPHRQLGLAPGARACTLLQRAHQSPASGALGQRCLLKFQIPDPKTVPEAHIFNRHSRGSCMHTSMEGPLSGSVLCGDSGIWSWAPPLTEQVTSTELNNAECLWPSLSGGKNAYLTGLV